MLCAAVGCGKRAGELEVVRKVKAARGDLRVTISSTGEVKPQNRVEIKPPVTGRVEEVLVKEGQTVTQGEVLAWMSSAERAALMDAAQSQGPEAVARWQDAYKPAPLMAPLSGTIIVRAVEPGQTVTTGDPVVVIADRLIVEALVDETDLAMITVGQEAEIHLDAYPDDRMPAAVDHIAYESKLINSVNVYAVDVLPLDVPPSFRSGMTATITFLVTDRVHVVVVPSEAVVEWPRNVPAPESAQFSVYRKVFGGKLEPLSVTLGESDGRMTEIVSGIEEGQELVVVRRKDAKVGTNPFSIQRRRPQAR